ncbi:PH domain-containing protein [Flavobacterium dauae]|uniref:PH domain-containing protein n=1 Tax=Flavobacterium dauae TaxID=1563479 RepID=UPI00101B290F|nr:PH domain-containing protein [Flavobacterium dauae]WLD22862.1 PH domain-containing protein [Flavobacterium dauae]
MNQKIRYNFSLPNKLDKKALFLVLGTTLYTVARAAWPIIALMVVKREFKSWYFFAVIGVIILITFVTKLINYFYFSYQVVDDELIIKKGWLNKSTTVVKLDKIHEVNLNQKFTHKIIGLYLINIDTAGSSSTEIEINGIDFQKALALKDVLTSSVEVETNQESTTILSDENDEVIIEDQTNNKIKISLISLIKIGLTRNYLQTFGLLIAFSFQIIDQLQDLFYEEDASVYDDIINNSYQEYLGVLGIVLFLGLIILIIVFNLVRTLFTYFNYQINLKDKHLTASYGLTDSHIISVPANKVQMFQFQQNYFQKLMNLFEVKIKQVESNEDNKKKKGLIIPGSNQLELNKIFNVIFSDSLIYLKNGYKPHIRILAIKTALLFIPAFITLMILYFTDYLLYSWIILPFFIIGCLLIYIGYKNEKMVFKGNFVILKSGIWDIATTYLPVDKIQKVSISQSIFQEKKQIGSLNLYTAAGIVTLNYYDFNVLQHMVNEILYKIEKNKHSWM